MSRPIGTFNTESLPVIESMETRLLSILCQADPRHGIISFDRNPHHTDHSTTPVVI